MTIRKMLQLGLIYTLTSTGYAASVDEYAKATYKGKPDLGTIASLRCQAGDFWDPRNGGECWSCNGNNRTIFPVTGNKACQSPGSEKLFKATEHKNHISSCANDSFFDPRNGGECWSCPRGMKRSLHAVTDDNACFTTKPRKNIKSKYQYDTGSVFKACKKGTFANVGSTKCYTCPKGYSHDIGKKVSTKGVCFKPAYKVFAKAKKTSSISVSCDRGQFFDVIHGGSCWSCPKGAHRTLHPVTHAKACSTIIFPQFSKADFKKKANVTTLGCDVKWKGAFFDPRKGGECWSCSASNPVRTLHPVTSPKACATKTCGNQNGRPCYVWERFPSCNKGLLEDPLSNQCVPPQQLACSTLVKTLAEIKKLDDEARAKGKQLAEDALDTIPGARSVMHFVKNVGDQTNEQARKVLEMVDYSQVTDEFQQLLNSNPEEVERFINVATQLGKKTKELQAILLDPKLVCSGDGNKVDRAILALGIDQYLADSEPGILERMSPIAVANARSKVTNKFVVNVPIGLPKYRTAIGVAVAPSLGFSYKTDFSGSNSLSFTQKIAFEKNSMDIFLTGTGLTIGWARDNGKPKFPNEYPIKVGINFFKKVNVGFYDSGFSGITFGLVSVKPNLDIFSDKNVDWSIKPKMEGSVFFKGGIKMWGTD